MPPAASFTAASPNVTRSKGEKLARRLSHILALLHQGDTLDKNHLAQDFEVDVRTIERDLGERLRDIVERDTDGRWQLCHAARSTIPARHLNDYAELAGTQHLFPDASLRYLLEQIETPASARATQVQPTPQEDLRAVAPQAAHTFAQLQLAIERCFECCFTYKGKPRRAQPYRLIHKNGVWYLAAEESGLLKNFSVALIEALQPCPDAGFTRKPEHLAYIDEQDDIWFTGHSTEVLLRVSPEMAHYFNRRALLPRQQQRAQPDGSLLVSSRISHINQLLPVVRYWLPHVRIVQPAAWHEELLRGLRQALARWDEGGAEAAAHALAPAPHDG